MSMQWSTIEDAIFTAVLAGSGLASDHVIWQGQPNLATPSGCYIGMRVNSIRMIGFADSFVTSATASPAPQQDVTTTIRGQRRCVLELNCYAGASIGASGAAAILESVLSTLGVDVVADPLADAGVGIASFTDVQIIDGVVNSTLLEPRARVEITFFASSDITFTGPGIQTVNITDQIPTPNDVFKVGP